MEGCPRRCLAGEIPDDTNGTVGTHSVVVYGNTASGDFLLADPWRGRVTARHVGRPLSCRHYRCRDRVRLHVYGILGGAADPTIPVRAIMFVVQVGPKTSVMVGMNVLWLKEADVRPYLKRRG